MPSQHPKPVLHGIQRRTPQRDLIVEILSDASGPLTATQISQIARQTRSHLGLATLYRTLKILQDSGVVRMVSLPDGLPRYERSGLGKHHFQCRACQQIWTINFGALVPLEVSRLEDGFLIEDHASTFYGFCPRCGKSRAA